MRAILRVPLSVFTVNESGTIVLGAALPKNLVKSPVVMASDAALALPPRWNSSCLSDDHCCCCDALSDALAENAAVEPCTSVLIESALCPDVEVSETMTMRPNVTELTNTGGLSAVIVPESDCACQSAGVSDGLKNGRRRRQRVVREGDSV